MTVMGPSVRGFLRLPVHPYRATSRCDQPAPIAAPHRPGPRSVRSTMTCGMHTPAHTAMDECVGQSDRMSVWNEFNCVMCSSATPTALLSLISQDPMFKTRPDCAVTRCSLTITCQTGECVSASADSASMLPSCGKLSMVAHDSRSNSIVTILNQQRTAGDSPSWAEA